MGFKLQAREEVVGLFAYGAGTHAVDRSKKADILAHGEVVVEREALTHVANVLLDVLKLVNDVATRHAPRAGCGATQPCEHVHGCGLAGSVGAEETEHFTTAHTETDVVDCAERAEGFYQMVHLNDIFRHTIALFCSFGKRRGREDVCKGTKHVVWTAHSFYFSSCHEGYAVATPHFVEVRGGNDNGKSALAQGYEHVPQFLAAYGVDARGGFVEKKHFGVVDEGAG